MIRSDDDVMHAFGDEPADDADDTLAGAQIVIG